MPTDARERVARAICRQNLISTRQPDDAETMEHYWKSFLPEADAALSTIGWREMVEALAKIANLDGGSSLRQECCGKFVVVTSSSGEPTGQDCCGNPVINGDWNEIARAALSRARGEKT